MRASIRILITSLLLTIPGVALAQTARIIQSSSPVSAAENAPGYTQATHPILASPAFEGLDTEFGTNGRVVTDINGSENLASDVTMLPDGRIVVVGSYVDQASFSENMAVVMHKADGSLDTSFGTGGVVITDVSVNEGDRAAKVAVQADGKIVVAGFAAGPAYEGDSDFAVVRYNPDGSLDTGFGTNGIVTTSVEGYDNVEGLAVLSDGKILVAGVVVQNPAQIGLVRYLADGSLDSSFGTGGILKSDAGADVVMEEMVVQSDGKILVLGNDYPVDFLSPEPILVRFNADGSLDASFGTAGIVYAQTDDYDPARSLAVDKDGMITVVGFVRESPFNGVNDVMLIRYQPDGNPDIEFGTNGKTRRQTETNDNFSSVVIQKDGKPLIAGMIDFENFALQRFNLDGTFDASFGAGGAILAPGSGSLVGAVLQEDGKLVVAASLEKNAPPDFQDMLLMRFDVGMTVTAIEETGVAPSTAFVLESNYPNPFQETTTIRFSLPEPGTAAVRVFDLMGREVTTVVNGYHQAGPVEAQFEAENLSAGVYFYQLSVDGRPVATRQMTRLK